MTVSTIYKLAAEMTTRGNLPAGVAAANKQLKTMQANLGSVGSSVAGLGRSIGSGAFQTAAAVTRGAGAAAGVAAAAAAGMMAKSGLEANMNLERMTNTIAGTLTLFNRNADATNQITANVKDASAALKALNKIADESPGSTAEIQDMFQRMLPGASAVTQDMERILKLTQNVAVLTPTFGTDFATAGAQIGRILTGGAGAEMEPFQKLRKLMSEIGAKMESVDGGKIFKKPINPFSDKFTQQFNQLNGLDRLALLEGAMGASGSKLAELYKTSWEGASASALSSVNKIKAAFTGPIFKKIKDSLVLHTSSPNSLLGSNRTDKMIATATSIGALMAGPVERALEKMSQGFRYVQENTYAVINKVYQGFQVAGAILRAAAAYMLSRMIIGAGLMAAGAAARGAQGVASGVSKAYGVTKSGVQGVRNATGAVSKFMASFKGGAVANSLGMFTMAAQVLGGLASASMVLVPMLLMAGAAFGVLSLGLLAGAGIAAYIASKWSELSASIVHGFETGAITVRPLIIAALILWERLKKVGEEFIGGASGASMMQTAINMATVAVNGLAEGVSLLAEIASLFLKTVAYGAKGASWLNTGRKVLGMGGVAGYKDIGAGMVDFFSEKMHGGAVASAMAMRDGTGGRDWTDKTLDMADRLTTAASSWRAVDLNSVNPADITSWTDTVTAAITDAFKPSEEEKKRKKGPSVSIGNLYMPVDLRGEDPDRALSALIIPLENMAKRPTASSADPVGGL